MLNIAAGEEYTVHTREFEGPLDLLLHLIRKNRMDIMNIRLSEITSQYLEYLDSRKGISPSSEGDFLMCASTLIYIKSRSLLPRAEAFEEDNPETKLVNILIEYDKIQKISMMLKDMEKGELVLWRRNEISEEFRDKEYDLSEVSSFQLAEVFLNILKKREKEDLFLIESKSYSIKEKWDQILAALDEEGYLNFSAFMSELTSLEDALVSFFTLLELVKQKEISAVQKGLFKDISVWKRDKEDNGK